MHKNATALLLPGNHYFMKGVLSLQQNATLQGSDVVLIFDNQSYFQFQDSSQIKLQGRQSGPYAGFVIATTPSNTNTFQISSDSARTLLGTIYIPNALLSVSGGSTNVADQSDWTVIIAKGLVLSGSPNLVINSNYAASAVPVPSGIGPSPTGSRLVQGVPRRGEMRGRYTYFHSRHMAADAPAWGNRYSVPAFPRGPRAAAGWAAVNFSVTGLATSMTALAPSKAGLIAIAGVPSRCWMFAMVAARSSVSISYWAMNFCAAVGLNWSITLNRWAETTPGTFTRSRMWMLVYQSSNAASWPATELLSTMST